MSVWLAEPSSGPGVLECLVCGRESCMVPLDIGIRGLSGDQTVWDRPVFIIPRNWETSYHREQKGGWVRGGLSWATVSSHDVLVRVVVRPRHRVTP